MNVIAFVALASLPFALMILLGRWQSSPRRLSNKRWRNIQKVIKSVDDDAEYLSSRRNHPAAQEKKRPDLKLV